MAEKLSITIFLDGAAEIERQLEGIGQAGTKAFDAIGTAAEKVGGFDKLDPKTVQAKLEQFGVKGKAAIDKITTAVAQAGRLERIVGGVRAVEDGFGKIGVAASAMSTRVTGAFTAIATAAAGTGGAIGRVGRALGILGSGALIGSVGAAAVAMEKTADAARVLEGNLQAIFRNAAAGTQFFNQIQQSARTAGTSLESTGKVMLDIVRTLQAGLKAKGISFAPGEGFKEITAQAQQLFDTLQKGMKLSGARSEEAEKAIAALNSEFKKTGQLSGDTLRKFAADFPQLANELVKFLGVPGQTMEQLADQVDRGIRKIDLPKFTNAVKQATPAIQGLSDAFDPTLAQRMDTISGAWNRLLDSFGKSPSGAAIKGAMDDIAKGLDEIVKKQEQVGKFTVEKPPETTTGKFFDQMFQEFNQNIEIAKENWRRLVAFVTDPIKLIELNIKLTPIGPLLDPLLRLIEVVKERFKLMFSEQPDVAAEPAWVQKYLGFIEKVKAAFKSMFTPDMAAADAPEPAWVQTYLGFIEKVKTAFLNMFTKRPEVGGSLGGGAVPLFGSATPALEAIGAARIEDRRGQGAIDTTAINSALTELAAAAAGATQSLQGLQGLDFSSIATAADFLNTAISSVADGMQSLDFSGMATALASTTAAAQELGTGLQSLGLSEVAAAMQQVVSAANNAAQALSNIQAQGSGGFAHGGLLGGRGTGTSDSNLAWVSRGEHIMPARAVRQPGVLAFLEALRHSGGSLRDVLDDMGRFALGGMVPRMIPAFAGGGLAGGGMSNVTIQFPGMPEISGLRAPAKVVEELRKTAALAQVRSGGRKPSRYS